MNQILKSLYGYGTKRHITFIEEVGGMNDEERKVFEMLHEQYTDVSIQMLLGLDRKSYERIESSVRAKLLLSVFECINHYMEDSML